MLREAGSIVEHLWQNQSSLALEVAAVHFRRLDAVLALRQLQISRLGCLGHCVQDEQRKQASSKAKLGARVHLRSDEAFHDRQGAIHKNALIKSEAYPDGVQTIKFVGFELVVLSTNEMRHVLRIDASKVALDEIVAKNEVDKVV